MHKNDFGKIEKPILAKNVQKIVVSIRVINDSLTHSSLFLGNNKM